jgi:hypothetical protein
MARSRQDETSKDSERDSAAQTAGADGSTDDRITGPLLLFNARGGFYQCSVMRAMPRGENETYQQYEPQNLRIPPGLYFVQDVDLWRQVRDNPGLRERLEDGEIRILGGMAGLRAADDWRRLKPRVAVALVQETSDLDTLRALLTAEERDEVADALQVQIDECTGDGQQKQGARRAQRAHNRGARNRLF